MKNTFELEHVGINTDNEGEAQQQARLQSKLFKWEPRNAQQSRIGAN